MSKPTKSNGMEHFSRLNSAVFLHEPTTRQSPNDPDLILLVGWMNASMRNLAKYTAGYEKLYPSARVVVITTSAVDAAFTTNSANLNRIAPALEIVYSLPPDAKVLLHLFSNGGGWTTTLIARTYQARTGKPFPTTGIILDSTPGKATYEATTNAFTVGLPKNILLRFVGTWFLRISLALYMLACWIGRKDDRVAQTRKDLNDETLFDINTPRLYIYSSADPMVAWQFVEDHMEEAQNIGYPVSKEKFVESGHCMHLLQNEGRYWGAITKLWAAISFSVSSLNRTVA